jgi:hypothetical protein
LEKRREGKRLSERERKEKREEMWEIEEEGGGDIIIPYLHHLHWDVRFQSLISFIILVSPIK